MHLKGEKLQLLYTTFHKTAHYLKHNKLCSISNTVKYKAHIKMKICEANNAVNFLRDLDRNLTWVTYIANICNKDSFKIYL